MAQGRQMKPAGKSLWKSISSKSWWPATKRTLVVVFFVLVLSLIAQQAREVEWSAVLSSVRAYPLHTLLIAASLVVGSYAMYSSYDLVARWHLGHRVPVVSVVLTGFIAYAFNLSLGAWLGAVALRYRLYTRLGLTPDVTTRILGLSLVTNWLGYCFMAGAVFLLYPLDLPPSWKLGNTGLQLVGAALLLLVAAYLALCWFARQRTWHVRGHAVELPGGKMALVQLALSSVNWLLVAGVVYVLLGGKVDYASTLSVLLLAAVAGLITRVPAGLGVLEGVFVALLSHRMAEGALLAGLLVYRALYQLVPLALAAGLLFYVDSRAKAGAGSAVPATPRVAP